MRDARCTTMTISKAFCELVDASTHHSLAKLIIRNILHFSLDKMNRHDNNLSSAGKPHSTKAHYHSVTSNFATFLQVPTSTIQRPSRNNSWEKSTVQGPPAMQQVSDGLERKAHGLSILTRTTAMSTATS